MQRIIILFFFVIVALPAYGQTNIQEGDRCFDSVDYDCAVTNYDNAFKNSSGRDRQIAEIKLTRAKWCAEHIKTADQAFSIKNYTSAKEEYQKVFDTNPKDEYASNQIDLCKKYIYKMTFGHILDKQKTYQSYLKENPDGFKEYRNKNCIIIDQMISELNESGYVNYTTSIIFDTLGKNLSSIIINSKSTKKIESYINISIISELLPVTESGFFIPTSDDVPFDVSWNINKLRVDYRAAKINIKPVEKLSSDFNFAINGYINQQSYANGIYKFEVVSKIVNDRTFSDLNLIEYRNNCGPLNSIYSMILPGWGTLKVSDGTKGKGRMTLFLLSTAISIGSKIYSNKEYTKYIEADNSGTGEEHYKNSNTANQIFLISGGISATIYFYDVIWVIGKGFKNFSQSKSFKKSINNAPVKVMKSPLKPF